MHHDHHHNQPSFQKVNKAFGIGIFLNISYIVVELTYGLIVNSMALIADAGHNLSDVLGLVLAWGASYLAQRAVTSTKTYGMRKTTILAALFNAIILFIAVGAISIEAVKRILTPNLVPGTTVMIVAGIGVIINTATALMFLKGKESDLNIKGAFLHMAADAGVSLGVVAAGLVIHLTSWYLIDPIISIIVVVVITVGTWGLLKDAFLLSIDAVPNEIDLRKIKTYLFSLPGVEDVHDLHVWAMSTTETALTAHLVLAELPDNDDFLRMVCRELHQKFRIDHPTIQLELDQSGVNCGDTRV